MAAAPNCVAVTVDKLPIKLPMGVLTADTITTFLLMMFSCLSLGKRELYLECLPCKAKLLL